MLDGLRLNDWHESIPREEFMTYFNFELVSATVISKQGLNVHLNIPVHHTSGYHQVYRAIPIPQPIGDGPTATRYRFDRTILLASKLRDNFAEICETKLHSHCRGSSRLKLCLKPFATSRSSASTCLSSLFSGLEVGALKLCPQEVIILPEEPIAEYLEDSTYLISSMKNTYEFFNYSDGGEKGEKIKGCRSCLVRPECGGRIENPSGSLVLYPDPRTCQYDAGFSLHVEPNWLIRTLFETLRKAELDVAPLRIPSASRGRAHQEMLQAFHMNLAELPEEPMDELALEEITRPFANTIVSQHVLPIKSVKAEASFAILMTMIGLIVIVLILCMLSRICPTPFRRARRMTRWLCGDKKRDDDLMMTYREQRQRDGRLGEPSVDGDLDPASSSGGSRNPQGEIPEWKKGAGHHSSNEVHTASTELHRKYRSLSDNSVLKTGGKTGGGTMSPSKPTNAKDVLRTPADWGTVSSSEL